MSLKSKIFLLIPLCFLIHIWLTIVFKFDVTPDWLFYDTDPHPEDPPVKGLLPDVLYVFIIFIFSPLSYFISSIYTAYNKLWWWFAAYQVLGFGFWIYLG